MLKNENTEKKKKKKKLVCLGWYKKISLFKKFVFSASV